MTDKPQQPTQSIVVNPVAQTETPNDSSFGLQPSAPVSPAPATSTCIDYFNFQHHATAGTSTTASYAPPPSSYQGTGSATALETDVITNPDGYSDSTNGAGLRVPSSADYALDRLFAEFENAANHRMTIFLTSQLDREVDLTNFIGQDLDVSFDRLLKSLGALASHRPKPVMDLIMKWRKSKSGAPDPQILATMTAPTLTDKASGARTSQTATQAAPSLSVAQITSILRQRQSVCSIFILCRALVAIVEQLQPESLSEELGEQLEEMVLRQMRGADPDMIHRNKNRAANMALFAQLLGALSLIRFASVSDKFIVELERYNRDVTKEKENQSKVEMVIKGMRYLKLKIYPDYALEDTADFLQSCAKFFKNAHGVKVKHAYAHLFVQLMLPIAAVAVAEVNFPAWVRAVDLIYPRALKMTTKPRHLTYGLPLVTTLLCVSKKDFFVNNWLQIVETCNQRFTKDKNTRQVALGCVCRLLWVYLYRCSEGTNATYRKLDAIIKTLYPSRRSINPADTPLDHFVQIAYFILMRHQDYGMENLIEYLLNADSLGPFQLYNVPLEIFAPERVTIAIRAYMLMLADLEKMEARPAFPISTDMRVTGISMRPLADLLSEKVIGRGIARETLEKMKEIMGKILVVLDQTYGNLIVTHEKNITRHPLYAVPSTVGAAAPPLVADSNLVTHHYASFSVSYPKERQPYFDLLRTIIDTMPRLMPAGLSLPKVVDLLCKYTVHIDPEVARAASEALIRIAKQMDAVTPVIGYAQYLQRFEDRFADVMTSLADGRFTGENRNGDANILKLYVNLLTIWVDQVNTEMLLRSDNGLDREKTPINENARDAEIAAIWSIIDDTEVNGVLFLCSRMTWVRRCAVQVLRLTADFEKRLEQQYKGSEKLDRPPSLVSQLTSHILNRDHTRVYQLLEQVGPDLVKIDKETNTLVGQRIGSAERGRIYQHQRRETKDVILMLASSDHVSDVTIWNTILPELVNILFESFPKTVAICRNNIYNRLIQIQPSIQATIDSVRSNPSGTISMTKIGSSKTTAATDDLIEQWRIYVTFACATIAVNDDHLPRRMATPKDLFKAILPYIACEHSLIRDAAVVSLGRINRSAYKVLMEDLQRFVRNIIEDSKQKTNQKPHLTKRNRKFDRLRIEVMHLYQLTADSLSRETYLRDDAIVDMIMTYVKETKSFLADAEVQMDWDFQKLRRYFCGLVERLYENLSRLEDPTKIMSFETRLSLFKMFEQWCGYGQSSKDTRDREARMLKDLLDQCKDSKERGILTSNMEDERKALETAALGAMAALCRGPVVAYIGREKRQASVQFDIMNLLGWIDAVFASEDARLHVIARRALEAILIYNQNQPLLLDDTIEQCYAGNPKLEFTQGYFLALADIVTRVDDYPHKFHQIMCLALFKAGDPKKLIRKRAIQLLRVVEEHVFRDSCANDYEIGIMSSLPAIYKQTQILLSVRLALDHQNVTDSMLSEMTHRFDNISSSYQRDVLGYMLPWIRNVDLAVGPQDTELNSSAFMLLSNLFYLTIKYGDTYVKEIEALWIHLLADHSRNVRAVITYLLDLGLEKRNLWFLVHAKRVLVYLGRTSVVKIVIEEIVAEINPRSMVPYVKEESKRHANALRYLFVADIEKVLPKSPKQLIFSRGQLATVFLVDLTVEAGLELAPHLPLLLHSVFVQLDHQIGLICDQMRCLIINLVHSIIIRQTISPTATQSGNALIAILNAKEGKRLWSYEDMTYRNRNITSTVELQSLAKMVTDVFSHVEPDIRQKWGEVALKLATSCPVRHIACRSFQTFRALMPNFNQHMLGDMLARLSNTISDKNEDIRGFALEILITLNAVADALEPDQIDQLPLLFWTALACMYSPFEVEYIEGLNLLSKFISKFKVASNQATLIGSLPNAWASKFDGLQPLLLKGLHMASAEALATSLIRSTFSMDSKLIDPSNARLLFLLLGSMPNLLHGLDGDVVDSECIAWANDLAQLFEQYSMQNLCHILSSYSKQRPRAQHDFLRQLIIALRDAFFPAYGQQAVVFTLVLLFNKLPHYIAKSLKILKIVLPYISKSSEGDIGVTKDVMDPLLRLFHTDYAEDALAVLDEAIAVTVGHTEQDPSSTGSFEPVWGVVQTDVASKTTRHNIHAIVYECAYNAQEPNMVLEPPEVDFEPTALSVRPTGKSGGVRMESLFISLDKLNDYFGDKDDDGLFDELDEGADPIVDGPDGSLILSQMHLTIPRIDFSDASNERDLVFPQHYSSSSSFFPSDMSPSDLSHIDYSNHTLAHHWKKSTSGQSLQVSYDMDSFDSATLDASTLSLTGNGANSMQARYDATRSSFETMETGETGETVETESTDTDRSEE